MKEDQIKKLAQLRDSKKERWSYSRLANYAARQFGIIRNPMQMKQLLDDYDKIAEPKMAPTLDEDYPGSGVPGTAFQLHREVMRRRPVRKEIPSNMRVIDISCAEGRKQIAQRLLADRMRKYSRVAPSVTMSGPAELDFDDGRRF